MSTIFEHAFRLSREPQCVVTFDGRIDAANAALSSLLGVLEAELEGRSLIELAHEDDRELLRVAHEEARTGGRPGLLCRLLRKDDSYGSFQLDGIHLPHGEGIFFSIRRVTVDASVMATNDDDFFSVLAQQIATTLDVKHVYLSKFVERSASKLMTLAGFSKDGMLSESFDYSLPSSRNEGDATDAPPFILSTRRPHHPHFESLGCENYLGIPIFDRMGNALGQIALFDDRSTLIDNHARRLEIVYGFARQAATELERIAAESVFRSAMAATVQLSGEDLLQALSRSVAEALDTRFALIATYLDQPPTRARALSFWGGKEHTACFEYDLAGTPCQKVSCGEPYLVTRGVQQAFPEDKDLVALSAESYLGVPLRDATGTPIGHIAVLDQAPLPQDERRRMLLELFAVRAASELVRMRSELAAQAHEERLRLVVENAADALYVWDAKGTITEVNRAAEESLGYERDELLGKELAEVQEGASAAWVAAELEDLRDGPMTIEATHRRKDGSTFPVEVRLALFTTESVPMVLGMARDITERKQVEALTEANLRAMSTPIIEVWDGVVALPVIGGVDRERAAQMMQLLLETISARRAEFAIVDLTGVSAVDGATASHLLDIARSAALLGSKCLLSGISPTIAQALVSLGADVRGLSTFGTLQSALGHAIAQRSARGLRSSGRRKDKPASE